MNLQKNVFSPIIEIVWSLAQRRTQTFLEVKVLEVFLFKNLSTFYTQWNTIEPKEASAIQSIWWNRNWRFSKTPLVCQFGVFLIQKMLTYQYIFNFESLQNSSQSPSNSLSSHYLHYGKKIWCFFTCTQL